MCFKTKKWDGVEEIPCVGAVDCWGGSEKEKKRKKKKKNFSAVVIEIYSLVSK